MPQNHTQGDIPLIAIATGSADQVECVLLKMGISQSEFTDPGGRGGSTLTQAAAQLARVDGHRFGHVPTQASLMGELAQLSISTTC